MLCTVSFIIGDPGTYDDLIVACACIGSILLVLLPICMWKTRVLECFRPSGKYLILK